MGLETGEFIGDLVQTNPVTATDPVTEGSNHLRLLKKVIQQSLGDMPGLLQFPDNNKYFGQANAAADGFINMIKVNTSDEVIVSDGGQVLKLLGAVETLDGLTVAKNDSFVFHVRNNSNTQFSVALQSFELLDSASAVQEYGRIGTTIDQNAAGAGEGRISLYHLVAGTMTESLRGNANAIHIRSGFNFNVDGGSLFLVGGAFTAPAAGAGQLFVDAVTGLNLAGRGSSFDLNLTNRNGSTILRVPTGTQLAEFRGGITLAGEVKSSGAGSFSAPGAGTFILYSEVVNGAVLGGQGSSNDILLVNKAGATALRVPTGTVNIVTGGGITAAGVIVALASSMDIDNTAGSSSTNMWVRNSEGGISLRTDNGHLFLYQTDSDKTIENLFIQGLNNAGLFLYHNGSAKFETLSTGVKATGAITATGDITAFV